MDTSIINQVVAELKDLPQALQWRVLEFTHALAISNPHGIPGQRLLSFAGAISPEDISLMQDAIERGCEQVDASEW